MSVAAPWNASWTGEDRYEVRPCRWADGQRALWQPHAPGSGEPVFAKPHFVRQRRSVVEMRCTVCGEKTHPGRRWQFPLGDWREINGRSIWLTTEAPVHQACADLAMRVCPHLRRTGFTPFPFPEVFQTLVTMIGGPQVELDFGVVSPRDNPIVGAIKIRLRESDVQRFVLPALTRAAP